MKKKQPTYFIYSNEEKEIGLIHYNRMLYYLYYKYIRPSGEYNSYHHYMECFYKSRNIINTTTEEELSYATSSDNDIILSDVSLYSSHESLMDNTSISSDNSLFRSHVTSSSDNNSISSSDNNSISSSDNNSISSSDNNSISSNNVTNYLSISADLVDISSIEQDSSETYYENNDQNIHIILTPVSPIRKKARYCFCF